MADVHSKEIRSYNMSQIKSKNTKPEELVRKYIFSKGFRYRKNVGLLPGRPDLVLKKYNTVIFINGCFWHMHEGCKEAHIPQSRSDYWKEKLTKNCERDKKNQKHLYDMGWKVLVVWECELKKRNIEKRLSELCEQIAAGD